MDCASIFDVYVLEGPQKNGSKGGGGGHFANLRGFFSSFAGGGPF